MLTYSDIDRSLAKYDKNNSGLRKFFVADKAEVTSLRRFARDDNKQLTSSHLFEVINILIVALSKNAKYKSAERKLIDSLSNAEVEELISATIELEELNILTKDNFEAVLTVKTKFPGNYGRLYATVFALDELKKSGILTLENRDAIIQCHGFPSHLAKILITLNEAGILTSENRKTLVNLPDLNDVRSALGWMHVPNPDLPQTALFITQDNFDAIVNHVKPSRLALELRMLAENGILNQQTRDVLKKLPEPWKVTHALICLHDPCGNYILPKKTYTESIFTSENIDAVANHDNPLDVVLALASLYQFQLLTPENRDVVKNHCQPKSLANALVALDYICKFNDKFKNSSFFAENIDLIKAHTDPNEFYRALYFLHQSDILTSENREAVKNHPCAELIAKALEIMYWSRCLTQGFFNRVIKAADPVNEVNALKSDLPRLRNETCAPYRKGAIQGLFSKIDPGFHDISGVIAQYVSRSSGANIAKTCKAAVAAARDKDEIALHKKRL